jgi:DNA mismatch endonuclease (patch repair protein)
VALPQMDNEEWIIENSACCKIPKTNTEFWVKKIARNQERDLEVKQKLKAMGWNCITIWECELKPAKREATLQSLTFTLNEIFLNNNRVKPYHEQESLPLIAAEETSEYRTKKKSQ